MNVAGSRAKESISGACGIEGPIEVIDLEEDPRIKSARRLQSRMGTREMRRKFCRAGNELGDSGI